MNPSALAAAFGAIREYAEPVDTPPGGTSELELNNLNFAFLQADSAGDKIIDLPNDGFILLINNFTGGGTISVRDSDATAVASIADNKTALLVRVGEETNNRWHATILKLGAT